MIGGHTLTARAILPLVNGRLLRQGGITTDVPDPAPPIRRITRRGGALLAGYLLLLAGGLELLGGHDPLGVVYLAAALLGALLLHRRWLALAIWLGVLAHGAWLVIVGNQFGLAVAAAGIAGTFLAWLREPEPSARPVTVEASAPEMPQTTSIVQTPAPTVAPAAVAPANAIAGEGVVLTLRTVGRIQVLAGSQDLTPRLLRRPVLSFVWLYLMARAAHTSGDQIARPSLAAELAPGLAPSAQKERLTDTLRDIRDHLPEELRDRILSTKEIAAFVPGASYWDVQQLRELTDRCRREGELISDEMLAEVEALLAELPSGDFLPGWEEIEQRVTGGRGVAGQLVRDVRRKVDQERANLAAVLAANYRARGELGRAIQPLHDSLKRSPEREDLARTLIAAYLESGQPERADRFRQMYEAGEV